MSTVTPVCIRSFILGYPLPSPHTLMKSRYSLNKKFHKKSKKEFKMPRFYITNCWSYRCLAYLIGNFAHIRYCAQNPRLVHRLLLSRAFRKLWSGLPTCRRYYRCSQLFILSVSETCQAEDSFNASDTVSQLIAQANWTRPKQLCYQLNPDKLEICYHRNTMEIRSLWQLSSLVFSPLSLYMLASSYSGLQ